MDASINWNSTTNQIDVTLPFGWCGWILVVFKNPGVQRAVTVNDPLSHVSTTIASWKTCPPSPTPLDLFQAYEFQTNMVQPGRTLSIVPSWSTACGDKDNMWTSTDLALAADTPMVKMKSYVFSGQDGSEIGITVSMQDNPFTGSDLHHHAHASNHEHEHGHSH